MLNFIPIHLMALEQSSDLKEILEKCIICEKDEEKVHFLNYEGWFEGAG